MVPAIYFLSKLLADIGYDFVLLPLLVDLLCSAHRVRELRQLASWFRKSTPGLAVGKRAGRDWTDPPSGDPSITL